MTRAKAGFICVIVCDVILVLGAFPLMRYTLIALQERPPNLSLLMVLLAANVAMLLVCLCGIGAWGYAFFHILRATHAKVANETAAISRKSTVSSKTTPAS